MMVLNESLKH